MSRALRAFVVLLLVWAGSAHALIPSYTGYKITGSSWNQPGVTYGPGMPDSVCQQWVAAGTAWLKGNNNPNSYIYAGLQGTAPNLSCKYSRSDNPNTFSYGALTSAGATCPANSSLSGTACQCNSQYAENAAHTACELNQAQCTPGQSISSGYFDGGSEIAKGPPYIVCNNGCAAAFDGEYPTGSALVQGKLHYFGKGTYSQTGSKCDSGGGVGVPSGSGNAPGASEEVPPDTCGPGEAKGVVNGKAVCAPDMSQPGQGTQPSQNPEPPKSDDKKTSESTSQTTTNADGSKTTTTTTTTKNVDGTSTTTTTTSTTNADGTPRSSSSTTTGSGVTKEAQDKAKDDAQSKCEKNAADTGCGGDPTAVNGAGLYTKKDKTVRGVLVAAKDSLNASPAGAAMGNFFSVGGGGACPTSTGSFALFNRTMSFSFDGFCSSSALSMFFIIKGVLLLIASVWAFRVAVE